MGKKRFICILILSCFVMLFLSGCDNSGSRGTTETKTEEKKAEGKLSVEEHHWHEKGSDAADPEVFTSLSKGDVVYDTTYAKIKVNSVSDEKIVLDVDGAMVEPNSDGTINLRKDPVEKITINAGDSIVLKSQTMDGGVNLKIQYE